MEKRDYYEVLEIERSATLSQIKSAYRKLAKKYHPDLNPNDKVAEEKFKEATEAYEVLSDENNRQKYDTYGHAAFSGAGASPDFGNFGNFGFGFEDLFSDFFGGQTSSRRRNAPQRGRDVKQVVNLTFKEAVFGVEKEVSYSNLTTCTECNGTGAENPSDIEECPICHGSGMVTTTTSTFLGQFSSRSTCKNCGGSGKVVKNKCKNCDGDGVVSNKKTVKVKIPAGVDNDSVIQMGGLGDSGVNGGPPGNLLVYLRIKEDKEIVRQGFNLYREVPISFVDACLGAVIKVETLDSVEEFDLPTGTQSETVFTIKNKGVPYLKREGRGDFMFKVKVHVPTKLTDRQKELLHEFSEESGEPVIESKKGFFEKAKDFIKDLGD